MDPEKLRQLTIDELRDARKRGEVSADEVREVFAEVSHSIKESIKSFQERMSPQIRDAVTRFAEFGWFISDEIGHIDIFELVAELESGDSRPVDDTFSKFFKANSNKIRKFLNKAFPDRKLIFNQGFEAHKQRKYFLSIPTFLIQADGICRDFLGVQFFRKKNGLPVTAEKLHAILAEPIDDAFLEPLRIVLPVSKNVDALDSALPLLNRHAILHGINVSFGTEINSLRAMSLVYFIGRLSHLKGKMFTANA